MHLAGSTKLPWCKDTLWSVFVDKSPFILDTMSAREGSVFPRLTCISIQVQAVQWEGWPWP